MSSFFLMNPASVLAPSVPTGLRVIRLTNGSVQLIWNESTEKSLSGYQVHHFLGSWVVVGEDLSSQCDGSETVFTTKNSYKPGTPLPVYWNGARLFDEVTELTETTFELSITPSDGDSLVIDLESLQMEGSWVQESGEDLSSQCDGSETVFETDNPYEPGSLAIWLNTLRQGSEVTEESNATFSLDSAPHSDDTLIAGYRYKEIRDSWRITGEDLSSQCDGSRTVFTTSKSYEGGTLRAFLNTAGLSDEVTELTATTFSLSVAPWADDTLTVDYKSTDDQVFTVLQKVTSNTFKHQDLGVGVHYYKINAVMNGIESALSSVVSASLAAPTAPDGVEIERRANSTILLTWNEATPSSRKEGFEGYEVHHSTDGSDYTLLETVTKQSYMHQSLDPDTHYYKVLTKANGARSALSVAVSTTMASPVTPEGIRITRLTGSSLRIQWLEATPSTSEEGLEGYEVHHSTNGTDYSLLESVTSQSYTHRDLDPATHYYKVRTLANGEESALSSAVSAVLASPSVPTGLSIERLNSRAVSLTWNEGAPSTSEEGFEGYEVHHSTDDATYTLIETVTGLNSRDRNLSPGTHYYKVRMLANGAESALCAAVSAVVAAPATPAGMRVNRIAGQSLRITWDQSEPSRSDEGFEGYKLYHSTDDVTYTVILTSNRELFSHLNLDPATHYYKVSHLANGAESALSAAVSVTIADPIPYVNTDTVATAGAPVTLDIETALGRKGTNGTIICLGPGVLEVEFSYDGGSTWTDVMELRPEDYFDLSDVEGHLEISDVRLDTDVSGTGYTVSIV